MQPWPSLAWSEGHVGTMRPAAATGGQGVPSVVCSQPSSSSAPITSVIAALRAADLHVSLFLSGGGAACLPASGMQAERGGREGGKAASARGI